jgi:hypothetical protein
MQSEGGRRGGGIGVLTLPSPDDMRSWIFSAIRDYKISLAPDAAGTIDTLVQLGLRNYEARVRESLARPGTTDPAETMARIENEAQRGIQWFFQRIALETERELTARSLIDWIKKLCPVWPFCRPA